MLGSSGDEGEGGGYLNPNINYNEVTDEESSEASSDEDDSDERFSDSEENEPRRKNQNCIIYLN